MENKITKCKGCGMPIFFQDGKPWYAKQVPFLITYPNDTKVQLKGYVSRFINCPKANQFSIKKSRKKRTAVAVDDDDFVRRGGRL